MGVARKSPKKESPARNRRSVAKTIKEENSPSKAAKEAVYSHRLPTGEQRKGNGRVVGRNLIVWNRPRMTEKLLLHIYYECTRHKINIPWDAIGHRLHPGSSGTAIVQHINRLRKELISEGHLVPPPSIKPNNSAPIDPAVRGYVRLDINGSDRYATRPVRYDEKLEDLRFNLPDSFSMELDAEAEEEYTQPPSSSDTTSGYGISFDSESKATKSESVSPSPEAVFQTPQKLPRSQSFNDVSYPRIPSVRDDFESDDHIFTSPSHGRLYDSMHDISRSAQQFRGYLPPPPFQIVDHTDAVADATTTQWKPFGDMYGHFHGHFMTGLFANNSLHHATTSHSFLPATFPMPMYAAHPSMGQEVDYESWTQFPMPMKSGTHRAMKMESTGSDSDTSLEKKSSHKDLDKGILHHHIDQ